MKPFKKLKLKFYLKKFLSACDRSNKIVTGDNVWLRGAIKGKNNYIHIDNNTISKNSFSRITLRIHGDNNTISIKSPYLIGNIDIFFGNTVQMNNSSIIIDEGVSFVRTKILMSQSGSILEVGKDCMFSADILIRTGEVPHLIFNRDTGEYLDTNSHIRIGNHCWVGEGVTILKNASIARHSIVGAKSVLTKSFTTEHVLIAGNPAKIRKENISWARDASCLEKNSLFEKNFLLHNLNV